MPNFDGLVSDGNITLTPDEIAEIFKDAGDASVVMSLGRQLRNMTSNELKLKVSTALPEVYFVGTKGKASTFPTGTAAALKQTTTSEWDNVSIYAGELAAIVVVPNNTFNDANFDVFGELRAQMPIAIAKKVDSAVIHGTVGVDVPGDWSSGILTQMPAGMKFALGANGDIYQDTLGVSGTFARVENVGYDVNGIVGAINLKGKLRNLRADSGAGAPLFQPTIQSPNNYTLAGVPIQFPKNGGLNVAAALMIAGDFDRLVWSLRQDVAFDVFDTGVIQDENGAIKHNLLQEDLTALRVTFRMAWGLPQPAQWLGTSSPYPFAAITP